MTYAYERFWLWMGRPLEAGHPLRMWREASPPYAEPHDRYLQIKWQLEVDWARLIVRHNGWYVMASYYDLPKWLVAIQEHRYRWNKSLCKALGLSRYALEPLYDKEYTKIIPYEVYTERSQLFRWEYRFDRMRKKYPPIKPSENIV